MYVMYWRSVINYSNEFKKSAHLLNKSIFFEKILVLFHYLRKLFNFLFVDLHNNETSPGSLKAIFESPRENYQTAVGSDSTNSSSKPRFVITPATLISSPKT